MATPSLLHADLTRSIIGAFYEVYDHLGAWHGELTYANAMEHELQLRGHAVAREVPELVHYKSRAVGRLRLDMVVDDLVVVELKAGFQMPPAALLQLYSYLKATRLEVGLLFHFGPKVQFRRARYANEQMEVVDRSVDS